MRGNEANIRDLRQEQEELISTHKKKTLRTTEILMRTLNLNMFWQSFKERYMDRKSSIDDLS